MNSLMDQQLIQDICDARPDVGTTIVGNDGRLLKVNRYICEMLGYDECELLGMSSQDITHAEDFASERPYLQRLIAGEIGHYQFSKRYWRKDGHLAWGMLDRSVLRDASGDPEFFIARIRDTAAQKHREPGGTSSGHSSNTCRRLPKAFRNGWNGAGDSLPTDTTKSLRSGVGGRGAISD